MRYADAGDVRIAYDDQGPRVDGGMVFLPGWCNSGRSFFALVAERLAARHRVIRLDWRGHGDSSRTNADFGHDELADDAMAVIEATDVHPVVLVAQAHGGWSAIQLSRRLGDRVAKIVVLSWFVLDPPPPFMAVFEMLQDPQRWRLGLDQLLAGRLADWRPGRGGRMGSPGDRQLRLRHVVAGSARGYGRLRPARQPAARGRGTGPQA